MEPELTPENVAPAADTSPRDVSGMSPIPSVAGVGAGPSASDWDQEAETVEILLEEGTFFAGVDSTHIALRGTPVPGSIRCDWVGIAYSHGAREGMLRALSGIPEGTELPTPTPLSELRTPEGDPATGAPHTVHDEQMAATLIPIIYGGYSDDIVHLYCFVDYTVSEYLLGSGPTTVTVAYYHWTREPSWSLIERIYERGGYEGDTRITQTEYETVRLDPYVREAQTALAGIVSQRDNVIFVFPGGAGGNIAVETWTAVAQWDLQQDDGVTYAVRYGLDEGDAEQLQTLANLKSRVTTAAASDSLSGSRVTTIPGITQHYGDVGAYGDITPDDETITFAPNQPPPILACRDSSAILGFALQRTASYPGHTGRKRIAQLEQEPPDGELDRRDHRGFARTCK